VTAQLQGIFPVLPAPFTDEGGIDPDAMGRVVGFALDCGVAGVVFPGFASEVEELKPDERSLLLRKVADSVGGRVPIVAGASADTAEAAIGHARAAMDCGIDTAMIQSPKSIGTGAEAVGAFYRAISDALPGLTILLQNAPAPRGSDLPPATMLEIVRGNPAIRYTKEETLPSGAAISALVGGKVAHLAGVMGGGGSRYVIEEYARGACGAMPALELADAHVALDRAWRAGDQAKARDIYMRTLPLLLIQANFRMRFTKYVLKRRGILDNIVVRGRVPAWDDTDIAEIDYWLDTVADLLPVGASVRAGALA
jgi:4-hydroxy-tetrahydrodipicolinate synthase